MTSEEQEALSIRYARGRWCVPLESGRIAIFRHPAGEFEQIVSETELVAAIARPLPSFQPRLEEAPVARPDVEDLLNDFTI